MTPWPSGSEDPTLNVHVVEPGDAVDLQRIADVHRNEQREVFELEEAVSFDREWMANLMSIIRAQTEEMKMRAEAYFSKQSM